VIYCYLFEAKSIQAYLFGSGQLRDVIAASERLDRLIDSTETSLLHQVLDSAQLDSDLLDADKCDSNGLIRFLRCKGGAFYCYANRIEPLLTLRSVWTLTVQQMFPSLEYTDALTQADSLAPALDRAHALLAQDRNTPSIHLPIATAPSDRYSRTGNARVPLSLLAKKASFVKDNKLDADLDIELHRQAYQALDMRRAAALQGRFTPPGLEPFSYPINLEEDFLFGDLNRDMTKVQREAVKDIALIHIDGNGLGILLMALKTALADSNIDDYRKGFRSFSEALNTATIAAARKATQFVYDSAKYFDVNDRKLMIPMRPIVLGGDDITLLCRADLALTYGQIFCREFKIASEIAMKPLFDRYLKKNTTLKPYLTASGGILYHKAGHPFTYSHHLVEELCAYAKKLTKSVNQNDQEVGPAALAFHRLSNAVYDNFEAVIDRSLTLGNDNWSVQIGRAAYFVEQSDSSVFPFDLAKLSLLVEFCSRDKTPVSMSRWRQMMTCVAMGDVDEANRIYHRGRELSNDKLCHELDVLLDALTPSGFDRINWFWTDNNDGKHYSIISDILIAHHFQHVTNATQAEEPNHA
jgi:hypothetical protein